MRMQSNCFGARDRGFFEVVLCSALAAADAWPFGGNQVYQYQMNWL
jgi:hypothetical protein